MKDIIKGILALSVICFFIASWTTNIYKLVKLDFEPNYKAEIIRAVGIFVPPVSWVVAWVDFEEEKSNE